MNRLYASLVVATLLFIPSFWKSEGAKPEAQPQVATQNSKDELRARKKAAFRKGRELLAQKQLPFDPDELLEPRWQQRLGRKLDQMPELQVVQQGSNKLKGAQLAHTLYLPENVQLTGDTVILARRLVFLGRNAVIKGNYDIHIFTLDETQLVDNSPFAKNKGGFVKVGLLSTSTLASLKPVQGTITIDVSGSGRDEWLQNQRQVAKVATKSKDSHHASLVPQNFSGANGANGTPGTNGNNGQMGNSGSDGPDGSCPENIDGGVGTSGADGSGGSDGGTGGNGNDGQNGQNVSFTAQVGNSYNVISNGGRGGDGGTGGAGGQGGLGGSGGDGGDGAACPCVFGSTNTSQGGRGGFAGYGGDGGNGADGGNGGRGGNGGTISIDYPSNYNLNNISTSVSGGAGGSAGAGGQGGFGGSPGSPGDGGNGNRGLACSGDGANGQSGGAGQNGDEGGAGNAGQPCGNGSDGQVNYNDIGGGEGGCQFDWECECECVCFEGVCSFGSPIVVDVLGNGFNMTDGVNGVRFDLNADGVKRGLAWTSVSTDDAWLALDRNANGLIDDGKELFGDVTQQPASEFPNGFEALAEFDKPAAGGNGDGKITNADTVFSSLRLWRDTNHNGISEASELHSLQSLGVEALHLNYKTSKRIDEFGNEFRYRSKMTTSKDSQLERWAWDVFLVSPR